MSGQARDTTVIEVRLGQRLAQWEKDESGRPALTTYLDGFVRGLLDDLGIAARYKIQCSAEEDLQAAFEIQIADHPLCTIFDLQGRSHGQDDRPLATRLSEALFANRACLLPPGTEAALWREWTDRGDPPPPEFEELLRALIDHGVRITRLGDLIAGSPASAAGAGSFGRLFEDVLGGLRDHRFRVLVSSEQHARLFREDGSPMPLSGEFESIHSMLEMMSDGLFYELGAVYPIPPFEIDGALEAYEIRFQINDLRTPRYACLSPSEFLVNDTVDRLTLIGIQGRFATNPANGAECAIVRDEGGARATCEEAGLTTWDDAGYSVLLISSIIRRSAGALLSSTVVKFLLDRIRLAFPALVDAAENRFELHELTAILRGVVDEEISLRDLRSILECLVAVRGDLTTDLSRYIVFVTSPTSLAPKDSLFPQGLASQGALVESVRNSLKRYISHKYTRGGNTLVVYLIDRSVEKRLADPSALKDQERHDLLRGILHELDNLPSTAQTPVLLTTMNVRARLRREIKVGFPHVAVLSYQELSPDMNIQPIARISWSR